MAKGDFAQRAPGTTSTSEQVERDWLRHKTAGEFTEAYTASVTEAMLNATKAMRGSTDAEVRGVAERKREDFKYNFKKFWSAQGFPVDEQAAEAAWGKLFKSAVDRYAKLRMQAAAPPLPSRPEPPPIEVGPILEPEPAPPQSPPTGETQPSGIMDAAQWLKWDGVPFTPESYHRFVAAFVPELTRAMDGFSSDLAMRTWQEQGVKNLFQQKLFGMYLNEPNAVKFQADHPEYTTESLRRNVQDWLDTEWQQVLGVAKKMRNR